MISYLGNLSLRLAGGAMRLPEELRRRHATFLSGQQRADGGFAGRQGDSDAYYTGFALRGLALLGELAAESADRAARFLVGLIDRPLPSVDFLSLVYSAVLLEVTHGLDVFALAGRDRRTVVETHLRRFLRGDGGYAKTETGPHSSVYHTFLAVTCRQLVGLPATDDPERLIRLVRSRFREDGGFVDLAPLPQGGTNPTAAAVALLTMFDALDEPTHRATARFLAGMQNAEGGLRANARIPMADLLSTFTGLVALTDLKASQSRFQNPHPPQDRSAVGGQPDSFETASGAIDRPAARRYIASLDTPAGGFRAGQWDNAVDVEYTFYGLGVSAIME
jgi:geranylgeranyl transferase type-2 subunit beta